MSRPVARITFMGALLLSATTVVAQAPPGISSLVTATGRCARFVIGAGQRQCNSVAYMNFTSGRTGFMFATGGGGSILISGGSDSQLTPERYVLNVDAIRVILAPNADVQSYRAGGQCVAIVTTSGDYLRSVSCRATNGSETLEIVFIGDNKPVQKKFL